MRESSLLVLNRRRQRAQSYQERRWRIRNASRIGRDEKLWSSKGVGMRFYWLSVRAIYRFNLLVTYKSHQLSQSVREYR